MADDVFDPLALTSAASLNQLLVTEEVPGDIAGRRAGDVCSRDALLELATTSGLTEVRPDRLMDDLATALACGEPATADMARVALVAFGHRLGALVVTLRSSRTAADQALSAERRAYLSHWLRVQSLWLAGGLVSGPAGDIVVDAARGAAARSERPCRIERAAHPELGPLVGAALHLPPTTDRAIVADLGHTHIKSAVVSCRAGAVTHIRLLPPRPAPPHGDPSAVADAVTSALAAGLTAGHFLRPGDVPALVSVAAYVRGGVPIDDDRGAYDRLGSHRAGLERRLLGATGLGVSLEFVHDGTAAAAVSGEANSATITAGSWLGVGFLPDPPPPLLGLARELEIER